jgi:hypothetical protein
MKAVYEYGETHVRTTFHGDRDALRRQVDAWLDKLNENDKIIIRGK